MYNYYFSKTPRDYPNNTEAVRNERRKCKRQFAKQERKLRTQLIREKKKNRYARESMRFFEGVKHKMAKVDSARQRMAYLKSMASPTKLKTDRAGKTYAKAFHVNPRSVRRENKGRREQKKRVANKTLRVLTFLQDPQWSVTYPGKKDLVCCRYTRIDDGKKVVWKRYLPKVVLTENLDDLHVVYCRQNPDAKVCLTTFQSIRRRS